MNTIVRGTTPSLIIDFSEITDFAVSEITEVALTVKQRTRTDTYGLSDLIADESTLTYHWTQEQTLAMRAGECIGIDMHVLANGERYKVRGIPEQIKVENTDYNEVM